MGIWIMWYISCSLGTFEESEGKSASVEISDLIWVNYVFFLPFQAAKHGNNPVGFEPVPLLDLGEGPFLEPCSSHLAGIFQEVLWYSKKEGKVQCHWSCISDSYSYTPSIIFISHILEILVFFNAWSLAPEFITTVCIEQTQEKRSEGKLQFGVMDRSGSL